MDNDGYVAIVGRSKDMLIRGGENIYPTEIENFLFTHPKLESVEVSYKTGRPLRFTSVQFELSCRCLESLMSDLVSRCVLGSRLRKENLLLWKTSKIFAREM